MEKKLEADIRKFLKGSNDLRKLDQKIAELEVKLGPQALDIMKVPIGPVALGGFLAVLASEIIDTLRQQNPGLFKDVPSNQAYAIIMELFEDLWNEEGRRPDG